MRKSTTFEKIKHYKGNTIWQDPSTEKYGCSRDRDGKSVEPKTADIDSIATCELLIEDCNRYLQFMS